MKKTLLLLAATISLGAAQLAYARRLSDLIHKLLICKDNSKFAQL